MVLERHQVREFDSINYFYGTMFAKSTNTQVLPMEYQFWKLFSNCPHHSCLQPRLIAPLVLFLLKIKAVHLMYALKILYAIEKVPNSVNKIMPLKQNNSYQ